MTISWRILLRLRNVLNKSCRENQNTNFVFSNLFRKSCRLLGNVEKYGGAREPKHDNTIWRMCVLCYTHAQTCTRPRAQSPSHARPHARVHTEICNIHCFSTATVVSRTLYLHCLACFCLLVFRLFLIKFRCSSFAIYVNTWQTQFSMEIM
jgi:hypothetical protein